MGVATAKPQRRLRVGPDVVARVLHQTCLGMTRVHLNLIARPGKRDELLGALDRLELAAAVDDAFLIDVELQLPLDDPDSVLVISSWPSPEHYARWESGIGWKTISNAIGPLLAREPEAHVYRLVDSIA